MSDEPKRPSPSNPAEGGLQEGKIGYKRPPLRTRFQPGRSGNPRGRPKGSKTLSATLQEALGKRIPVREHGRTRMMKVQDVIVRGLVSDAARRDPRALKLLFALHARYADSSETSVEPQDLTAQDQAIIEAYVAGRAATLESKALAREENDESSVGPGKTTSERG